MAMTNEDYAINNITGVDRVDLENELEYLDIQGKAAAVGQVAAELAGNVSLAFAHASDLGVLTYKYELVDRAIQAQKYASGELDINELLTSIFGS